MNWNDDDPFIKWSTRIYVVAVVFIYLIVLPLVFDWIS